MGEQPPLVLDVHYQVREGEVRVTTEGFEVMRVLFSADNLGSALFEKLKLSKPFLTISEEQRNRIYEEVRKIVAEQGFEISAEEVKALEGEALRKLELMFIKQSIEVSTKRVSENLFNVVSVIWEKLIQLMAFSGANEMRDILEQYGEKYSAKEIRDAIFQPEWERIKNLAGVSRGGARRGKTTSSWDDEKAKQFYQAVQSFPPISKKPLWEYAQEQLRENDYNDSTRVWLKSHPAFTDCPENLLKEASTAWRTYEEAGKNIPAKFKPLAFAFRHACSKLGYPEKAYNTLRKRYYEGKKLVESEK